ncbi:hypothetical protein Agabi119p4_286 [Agaricus bisporus var. burnettii]|uniref:2,5-diamino-6-ribosylamino-4(3H)-pyrimidinone 5'-phosphate reductase n=1 Tax=Agaricus bisporus var. burnettii TaxID=192524 RepID=A0A8H7KKT3_AGABI|nr:hypothetical protein Agabi119p4_286 [Agaricus bisporus var. burnettii]
MHSDSAMAGQQSPPAFLLSALAHLEESSPADRPHVTLTFAQSLDAKIAGKNGKQLILSGKDSMLMTHWMRTMHNGIMVGVGTAVNDDPQLNTRHLPARLDGLPHRLPRPIILDPRLRLSPNCKLVKNFSSNVGLQPWIICTAPAESEERRDWQERHEALVAAGALLVQVDSTSNLLPLPSILRRLKTLGIQSLMIEGGARLIDSCFHASPFIDALIVTVAPTLVGPAGLNYGSLIPSGIPHLKHHSTQVVGTDAVIVFKKSETVDV